MSPPASTADKPLAWSIAVGGISIVAFAAGLALAWYAATTLFMILAGILFAVFLNALADFLGRLTGGPQAMRLVIVCLLLAAVIAGIVVLGGATIAQQASALSSTIKSQAGVVKEFLEQRGVDTSILNFNVVKNDDDTAAAAPRNLPSAGAIATGTGAILGPTLRVILGIFEGFGNFFIVIFLGVMLAAQPRLYIDGVLSFVPKRHTARARAIADDLGETLRRWLLGQLVTMLAIFALVWIGLSLIGIPGALVLGAQAGLLSFIPTVGSVISGFIIILASLGSGWAAIASAFGIYLLVQFLEGNVLTPIIQRYAIDIPPATLFGVQILLGVLFGLWGLALALPIIAIVKVVLRQLYRDEEPTPAVILVPSA